MTNKFYIFRLKFHNWNIYLFILILNIFNRAYLTLAQICCLKLLMGSHERRQISRRIRNNNYVKLHVMCDPTDVWKQLQTKNKWSSLIRSGLAVYCISAKRNETKRCYNNVKAQFNFWKPLPPENNIFLNLEYNYIHLFIDVLLSFENCVQYQVVKVCDH